jgi:ribonuclease T1
VAALVVLAALSACSREAAVSLEHGSQIAVADLPAEARATLALIKRGGPFPYRQDGTVFQNRESRLPVQPRGYYAEYTVPSANESGRGPRRLVAGKGSTGDVATGGEYWYTADHYNSFQRVRE